MDLFLVNENDSCMKQKEEKTCNTLAFPLHK